jgi:hypothetical protein
MSEFKSDLFLMEGLNNNSPKAQCRRLLDYLRAHGSVSTMYAQENLNIYDPPARIHFLRHKLGCHIQTSWVIAINSQGYSHRVGMYTLVDEHGTQTD